MLRGYELPGNTRFKLAGRRGLALFQESDKKGSYYVMWYDSAATEYLELGLQSGLLIADGEVYLIPKPTKDAILDRLDRGEEIREWIKSLDEWD